jgi:hypothetical protein
VFRLNCLSLIQFILCIDDKVQLYQGEIQDFKLYILIFAANLRINDSSSYKINLRIFIKGPGVFIIYHFSV